MMYPNGNASLSAACASKQSRDSALVRKKRGGMTRIGKYRVGWVCLLLLSFAGYSMAQSLDAGIPSTSIDSNVSARPQVQDPSGEPVQASQPAMQDAAPNAQINSDVTENPETIVRSERGTSAQSPAALKSSSIAGWSVAQSESQRGMQTPHPSGRLNDRSRVRTLRQFRTPSNRLGRGMAQKTYDRVQPRAEGKATHGRSLPAIGYSENEGSATFRSEIPDSTRRPSLASPPDPGTESPLAWSPSLSVGIDDIQTSSFLNPSLHVRSKRHSRNFPKKNYRPTAVLSEESTLDQSLKPDIDRQLQDILNPPALSPLSSVDQQLNPNADQ